MKPISIKVSLLTYYLVLVGSIAGLLIGLQYYYSLRLAEQAAGQTFEQTAEKLGIFIRERDNQLVGVIDLMSLDRNLHDFPAPEALHAAMPAFINLLQNNKNIYAVYVGKDNGDFYEVINLNHSAGLHQRFETNPEARWLVIQITGENGNRSRHFSFYDADLKALGGRQEFTRYDPTIRPWFARAQETDHVIRTEPYLFSFLGASGITYAAPLSTGDGVLAVDISMTALNNFLATQKLSDNSELFLYDQFGEKYASSIPLKMGAGKLKPLKIEVEPIALTEQERAYITAHPTLRVSNETDWPPIDFAIRGEPAGYAVDLLRILAQKTGLELQFINGFSWNELVELFKTGKLDALQSAFYTPERAEFGLFSEPILEIRNRLIHRKGLSVDGISDLNGKVIALPAGWSSVAFLKSQHPEIQVIEVDQSIDAYIAVNRGEADATVDHRFSARFIIDKFGLDGIEVGPWFSGFDEGKAKPIHIVVRPQLEPLHRILNKALAALTEAERSALDQRWQDPLCSGEQECQEAVIDRDNVVPAAFMKTGQDESSGLMRFDREGNQQLGYSVPLKTVTDIGTRHRLGLTEPPDRFVAPFLEKVQISLYLAVLVLLAAIPAVLFATRQILKPIYALMEENEKIAHRRYSEVKPVDTQIRELLSLSGSLLNMSERIRAYQQAQEELMDSVIQLIADAIDAKSPYTAGHCKRVPTIAEMLVQKAHESTDGPFADFHFDSKDEWREFHIGAWLHDCGKVTTPEYVVDKATKLETIVNRIHEVRTRFEVLWRDAEIASLKRQLSGEDAAKIADWLVAEQRKLRDDFAFVAECNIGGEFMSEESQQRLREIAATTWIRHFDNRIGISEDEEQRFADTPEPALPVEEQLLSDRPEHIVPRINFDLDAYTAQGFKLEVPEQLYNYGEVYNLGVGRGTLTVEERFKINEHIIMTIRMLEQLPLPDNLKRVPEYAGTHHETLIGTGYPKKLVAGELSLQARIMTLADIFEALTASDRPYKKAKTLSESIKIMGFMCEDGHIDADVFKLFLTSGVYRQYGEKYLLESQIDEVDIDAYMDCSMKQ